MGTIQFEYITEDDSVIISETINSRIEELPSYAKALKGKGEVDLYRFSYPVLLASLFLNVFFVYGQKKESINMHEDTVIRREDTTKQNILKHVNLKKYIGKTVDKLLQDSIIKDYKDYWWTDEPPGKLQSLNLTFAKGLYLEIYPVRKHGQAVQFSIRREFDFETFKKMKIQKLIISEN